jgi:DNA-binding transcriptional ArsR family regulator
MTRNQRDQTYKLAIIPDKVFRDAKSKMPKNEILYDLAEFFKIFGYSTRIKIVYALLSSEMCVQDLATLLAMNQSAVSHQLRILKQAKVVKYRKEGKYALYSLDDEHVTQIVAQGIAHLSEK